MPRLIYFYFATILSAVPCWGQSAPQLQAQPIPTSVMKALPGVYRIEVSGEGKVRVPQSVRVKWRELAADAETAKATSEVGKGLSMAFHLWNELGKKPEKYLEASKEMDTIPLYGGSGSGFAISREGVLLTNRHVVNEFDDAPLKLGDLERSAKEQTATLLDELLDKIDFEESDLLVVKQTISSVGTWYAAQGRKTFRRKAIAVVVAYASPDDRSADPSVIAAKLFEVPADLKKPILLPASVVGLGGKELAEDVAILKIDVDVQDALICLPLSQNDQAKLNDPIFSLGFPGFRYDEGKMSLLQLCQVNVEPGKIDYLPASGEARFRELAMLHPKGLSLSDRSMLAVTALIRPGSSGGPVVLNNGAVIGLNVAYRDLPVDEQNKSPLFGKKKQAWLTTVLNKVDRPAPTSVNFTVPIDVAHRLLEKHKIEPDIGDTTRNWHEGIKLFEQGDKQAAKLQFQKVASHQKARFVEKPTARTTASINIVSHYVSEMIERCD